jgi:hypothetical protein
MQNALTPRASLNDLVDNTQSAEIRDWWKNCPDPQAARRLVEQYKWWTKKKACDCCDVKYERNALRANLGRVHPLDEDSMYCRGCWQNIAADYHEGTIWQPDFRPEPWPEEFVLPPKESDYPNVYILCKDKIIGTAHCYRASSHFAAKVSLVEFPGEEEAGTLDRSWETITEKQRIQKGLIIPTGVSPLEQAE